MALCSSHPWLHCLCNKTLFTRWDGSTETQRVSSFIYFLKIPPVFIGPCFYHSGSGTSVKLVDHWSNVGWDDLNPLVTMSWFTCLTFFVFFCGQCDPDTTANPCRQGKNTHTQLTEVALPLLPLVVSLFHWGKSVKRKKTTYTIVPKVFTHPSKWSESGVPITSVATGI